MKQILITLWLFTCSYLNAQMVTISPKESVDLSYEAFATQDINLINPGSADVLVGVYNPGETEQVKGFSLAPRGSATLTVGENQILRLRNLSDKEISIKFEFIEREKEAPVARSGEYITFTLRNSSLKSIPLIIPNVMNPNLSPMSNSGVSLKVGQKIYLKKGMRKILVLTVDESIKNGDKIDIAKLVKDL